MEARKFGKLVDSFCESPNDEKRLKISDKLNLWKNNHVKLLTNIKSSPILKEIESMSKDLMTISEVGIQVLNDCKNDTKKDEMWVKKITEKLDAAKKPRGQTELKIISAIENLVNFVKNLFINGVFISDY